MSPYPAPGTRRLRVGALDTRKAPTVAETKGTVGELRREERGEGGSGLRAV